MHRPVDACERKNLIRRHIQIAIGSTPVFIKPRILQAPLTSLRVGTALPVEEVVGDWLRVRFSDHRWGNRVGYLHCSHARVISDPGEPQPVAQVTDAAAPVSASAGPAAAPQPSETIHRKVRNKQVRVDDNVYLEWRRDDYVIVEGQRLIWDEKTKLSDKEFAAMAAVPLGSEVIARGVRLADGTILAREIQIKPNGSAIFESELREYFAALEDAMRRDGYLARLGPNNKLQRIGPLVTEGPIGLGCEQSSSGFCRPT